MKDAMEYVKRCDACQRMQSVPRQLIAEMSPIVSAIPFAMWSIDLAGGGDEQDHIHCLVYRTEVVFPIEVYLLNIHQVGFDEEKNKEGMRAHLDFTGELRDQALHRMQEQKRRMSRFYNRKVRGMQFNVGDLVLRVMKASQRKNKNKLNPKWEGPYRVRNVVGPGTNELVELSGKETDHTWQGIYLKKYYV
ncbi:hypothetical protein LIER_13511 [Lithospermum erythrorhizon]|uniref:Integrase zinc-binding domain-containing protein n=1 Tax=Lithospermum erythrorhizon TaxID=34254 RepID=A0AAV3PW58_LITER